MKRGLSQMAKLLIYQSCYVLGFGNQTWWETWAIFTGAFRHILQDEETTRVIKPSNEKPTMLTVNMGLLISSFDVTKSENKVSKCLDSHKQSWVWVHLTWRETWHCRSDHMQVLAFCIYGYSGPCPWILAAPGRTVHHRKLFLTSVNNPPQTCNAVLDFSGLEILVYIHPVKRVGLISINSICSCLSLLSACQPSGERILFWSVCVCVCTDGGYSADCGLVSQ